MIKTKIKWKNIIKLKFFIITIAYKANLKKKSNFINFLIFIRRKGFFTKLKRLKQKTLTTNDDNSTLIALITNNNNST